MDAMRYAAMVRETAIRLIEIMRGPGTFQDQKMAMRAVGRRLYAEHGFPAMQDVADEVRQLVPFGEGGEDGWHPQHVDNAWDGIGPWRW
jgi:hypothetical protein